MNEHQHSDLLILAGELVGHLFRAEYRRLSKRLDELNAQNCALIGRAVPGFVYQGVTYVPYGMREAARVFNKNDALPTLHMTLNSAVQEMVLDWRQIDLDRDLIRQTIVGLVSTARSLQDFRDCLPDCMVPYHESIKHLPRYNSQEHIVQFTERRHRQYLKILPKIEMYCVSRLLY